MTRSPSLRAWLIASCPLAACSAAPPASPNGPRFVVEEHSIPRGIGSDTGPAPCDCTRSYRGKIGQTPVTQLLRAASAATSPRSLEGIAHYDRAWAGIVVTGSLSSAFEGSTLRSWREERAAH